MGAFLSWHILVPVVEIADLTGALICLERGTVFWFSMGSVGSRKPN
jgi:hypothetical protein